LKYLTFDGSLSSNKRQERVTAFNEDMSYDCFILSKQAGSLGLTLNTAQIELFSLIHSADNQCVDRAYSVGQKNVVCHNDI
jgi:SNF2 family DNA or RNA helicase